MNNLRDCKCHLRVYDFLNMYEAIHSGCQVNEGYTKESKMKTNLKAVHVDLLSDQKWFQITERKWSYTKKNKTKNKQKKNKKW